MIYWIKTSYCRYCDERVYCLHTFGGWVHYSQMFRMSISGMKSMRARQWKCETLVNHATPNGRISLAAIDGSWFRDVS